MEIENTELNAFEKVELEMQEALEKAVTDEDSDKIEASFEKKFDAAFEQVEKEMEEKIQSEEKALEAEQKASEDELLAQEKADEENQAWEDKKKEYLELTIEELSKKYLVSEHKRFAKSLELEVSWNEDEIIQKIKDFLSD